jgi:hypothetical protein
LADIGYDNTNLVAMPFDWRLSIPNMELRDAFFTKLRSQVRQGASQASALCNVLGAETPGQGM